MQNAKDSFYLAMRSRLAVVNPARQIVIGGVDRPGLLVEENETVTAIPPTDAFVLRWTTTAVKQALPAQMEALDCEICYSTCGTAGNEQMDRGRALTEMDAELAAMMQPQQAQKQSVGTQRTVPLTTNIFWSALMYGPVKRLGSKLSRSATVRVYSLQEILLSGEEEL